MTIQQRLTILFAVLVSLVVIPSNIISWQFVSHNFYELKEIEARDKAQEFQELIQVLKYLQLPTKQTNQHELFSQLIQDIQDNTFIQIQSSQKKLIAQSKNLALEGFLRPECSSNTSGYMTLEKEQLDVVYFCQFLNSDGLFLGKIIVMIPLKETKIILKTLFIQEVIQTLVIIFASIFLGQFWSKKALNPIKQITQEVNKSIEGNLFQQLDISHLAKDEVKLLAETFNTLLQKIRVMFYAQKRFLSNASHELRSPLTSIQGHTQLALKRGKEYPHILEESLHSIDRETQRLQRLVNEVLELSKQEQIQFEMAEVNFLSIINDVLLDYIKPIQNKIIIIQQHENLISSTIMGHSDSLKQVLINLLTNALRVVDPVHGKINIYSKNVDNCLQVSIQDNGSGIPEESMSHLFERFYRVDNSRSRQYGGSGLGLSIVKEILDNHHADIKVYSKMGQGTTFTMEFPLV